MKRFGFIVVVLALSAATGSCAGAKAEEYVSNIQAPIVRVREEAPMGHEYALLGGGCFWCLEAVFEKLPGVIDVVNGYAGGTRDNPTYEEVCGGETGHAEIVRIEYDPSIVTFDRLLELFWKIHDPTTLNRQGADVGTQYRSVIFYYSDEQKEVAKSSIALAQQQYEKPIVTELLPAPIFWRAEDYHQDYFRKHPENAYCQIVIAPKIRKSGL